MENIILFIKSYDLGNNFLCT